jgi:hypothetical protein
MGTLGTQELSSRARWRGRNAGRRTARIGVIAVAVAPLVAGCSSFSSPLPSSAPTSNQAMAVPPPPNAAAPASASAAPAYQPQGQPPAQQQANGGNSNAFLSMFRDPPSQQEYDARASTYPQQSLTDLFKGSTDQRAAPDPSGAGYPLQPLISSQPATPSAQQANMPHPPSTYTPSQQPYVPPQPTPASYSPPGGAPPAAGPAQQPTAQAPANAGVYPQQSLSDLFKSNGQ